MASDVAYSAYNYGVAPAVGLAGIANFNGTALASNSACALEERKKLLENLKKADK